MIIDTIQPKINLLDDQIENLERSGFFTEEVINSEVERLKRLKSYLEKLQGEKIYNKHLLAVCPYCNAVRLMAQEKGMSAEMNREFLKLRYKGFFFRSITTDEFPEVVKTMHCKLGCENQHL